MGWSLGYDSHWKRDIGYGVPALCDHPGCGKQIDRGLAYVCGGEPWGGDEGCGLFFCAEHRGFRETLRASGQPVCARCQAGEEPFEPTPDHPGWIAWKLTDESWAGWRAENPDEVARLRSSPSTPGECR